MKKQFLVLCLLLALTTPSLLLMFKNPLYPSHDGLYHVGRISQFNIAFQNGQIPPRLAPTIENNIGYPLFIVNYQLPYYFAEAFTSVTQDPIFAFKAVMSATFILGTVFAFLLFKNFGSNIASLTGAIFYTYLPYRFANLYDRGSLGECVALMFVPLTLLGLHQIKKNSKYSFVLLAISVFGLITSHTVIFMIFAPFFILYFLIILKPDAVTYKRATASSLLGIMLSAFQLLPSIFEKRYMTFDQTLSNLYKAHFINIYQVFRLPHPGVNLGTPFQVGLSATLVIALSLIFIRGRKRKEVIFMLASIMISLFIALPVSSFLWQNLPLLKYILYPWRLLSVVTLASSYLAVFLVDSIKYKKTAAIFLIILTIYASRHYFLKPAQLQPNPPTENLTTQNENDTIWSNEKTFTQRPLVSTKPQSNIYLSSQKPFDAKAEIINTEPADIIIRKMYFPGWILKVNGKSRPVAIEEGLISTNLEPGNWQIEAYFTESKLRKFADLLTLASLAVLLILFIKPKLSLKI